MIHDGLSQDVEPNQSRRTPHDVVANMQDCDTIGREFELQSCYYVHFHTYTRMNSLGMG